MFLDPIIENGVKAGQALGSAIAPALGISDKAITEANNQAVTVPGLKTPIKAPSTDTPENVAGRAVSTIAIGMGNPAAAGAAMGLGSAMQEDKGPVGTAIETVASAVGGKILEHGFNAVMPYIEKAAVKYGQPFLDKIAHLVPDSAKSVIGTLSNKVKDMAVKTTESDVLPASINTVKDKVSSIVDDAIVSGEKKVSNTANNFADNLEKQSLRLTPTQKAKLGSKLDEIAKYNTENGISGSPEHRLEKILTKVDDYEDKIQAFLTKDASERFVEKGKILDELEGMKSGYQNERDVVQIEKQIDDIKNLIQTRYPDKIPVDKLNNLKRSTYQNAYNQAGNKVLDSVEHDAADVFKNSIESATDGLTIDGKAVGDFNREYGTAIQSKKLLKIASGRPQIGLLGKMTSKAIGSLVGASVGGPVGFATGGVLGDGIAEKLVGTNARSTAATLIKKITK